MWARRRVLIRTAASLAALGAWQAGAEMPPPADPVTVMEESFAQAVGAGTNAALILFIARYPEHELAEQARRRLRSRTAPDPAPMDGPDGRLIAAFDRARLDGGAAALDRFARRHAGHPLAAEAKRPIWRTR